MTTTMRTWVVADPGLPGGGSLERRIRAVPAPREDEVLVRVDACGLCRTDLHLAAGDLPPRHPEVVPGHQVVGRVVETGTAVARFTRGDRVGIAWLRRTCGECSWCRRGAENLCPGSRYTGWDEDGGFAQYAVVPAGFAYRLPEALDDVHAAPLLCAGIIGYRALRRAKLPVGGRLGILGFGSSAHITAQIAIAQGAEVHVMTRGQEARALARDLGVASVGGPIDPPPVDLDSAIVFAPAGDLVPVALRSLARGGTVALAGIHMSTIPPLDYDRDLFQERSIRSVTANTRADGQQLLALAGRVPLAVHTTTYDFQQVPRAMDDVDAGRVTGSVVITGFAE